MVILNGQEGTQKFDINLTSQGVKEPQIGSQMPPAIYGS